MPKPPRNRSAAAPAAVAASPAAADGAAPSRAALIEAGRRTCASAVVDADGVCSWGLPQARALAAALDEIGDTYREGYRAAHGKEPSSNGWPMAGGGDDGPPFSLENFQPCKPDGGR